MAPLFWLPLGFLAGLAAAALVGLGAGDAGRGDAAVRRRNTPESRVARLRRLNRPVEELAQNIAFAEELTGLQEFQEIVAILSDTETPVEEVVNYAIGNVWTLGAAALCALAARKDGANEASRILEHLDGMVIWQVHFALKYLSSLDNPPAVGAPLAAFQSFWSDNSVMQHIFREYFARMERRGRAPQLPPEVRGLPMNIREDIRTFLSQVRGRVAERLTALLDLPPPAATPAASDPPSPGSSAFLDSLGRFWGKDDDLNTPIEPPDWRDALQDAQKAMQRTPLRSLLVSGDTLVGKTSFLKLLAKRIEADGWRVFEASGADLQAGQQYFGQLEGRIRQALDELSASRKVIWYVPDLLALALSGTHQGQSASILDQILPAIAAGRLVVWAEASATSSARLMQLRPAVRRSFETIRLDPLDAEETMPLARALATAIAFTGKQTVADDFLTSAIDAARHYLSASALPGSALGLMKLAALRSERAREGHLSGRDILDALAQLTGLPQSILDGSERLDLEEVTSFFSKRVIGQPDAVTSVVERIAMLKSGLNDPMKPFGVFLFAGPTGTGKTELAKAIAEFLFGSVDRMIRLDMSEYQSPDTVMKIIGGPGMPPEADTLISRIRKQPFSLVLLDEFEKSSPNIWDLFLQVFDEGRLTDTYGQTADFRHSLIILTTNLGATSHQSGGLGFAPSRAIYTNDQIIRAIGQTFRPEFQNRLDKVIVFRPLTREHMRGILKKELDRLYERRGMKDRHWAVEWEASALEFLLEKGFSADMGARPLKRAIDQFVVAPLAAAIVERRAPEGEQFVFVRSDGTALQADFLDPDSDGEPVPMDAAFLDPPQPTELPSLPSLIQAPQCTQAEIDFLAKEQDEIAARVSAPQWMSRKAELAEAINKPGFWARPDRFEVLAQFELMDRVAVAAQAAQSMRERLARTRAKPSKSARELIARLAMQASLVRQGLADIDEGAPIEVALAVESALDGGNAERASIAEWRGQILDMYRGWCRRRGMQLAELEAADGHGAIQLVTGFGANRILSREAGLHILEQPENGGPGRVAVRVLVVPSPLGELSKAQRRAKLIEAFAKAPRPAAVVRRYRRGPSPLVRNADGSLRSGKLDAVLAGDFDLLGLTGA